MYLQVGAGTNHETSLPSFIALRIKVPDISFTGASISRTDAMERIASTVGREYPPAEPDDDDR